MGGVTDAHFTEEDAAKRYGRSRGWVLAKCRGPEPEWPHLRVGKSVRFTAEHFAAIDRQLEVGNAAPVGPTAAEQWGRRGRTA